jgi:tetrahydromethanopterin S-methyltransferase subunit G
MKKVLIIVTLFNSLTTFSQEKPIPYTQIDKNRIEEIDRRLIKVETKLEEIDKRIDARFATVDTRFDQLEKRIDFTNNLIIALLVSIIGMTTFIWWYRKTALDPTERKYEILLKKISDLEQILQSKGIL